MTLELAQSPVAQPQQVPEKMAQLQQGQDEQQANGNGNGHVVPELELHRACVEGKVEDVRAVLSRGLEQLETLDMSTGCTPIVLAIRSNNAEVVRELLTAGAIVPPPGLTNDPVMLSLLYPQPMYGLPPQFMGHQGMSMPAEFYPQQGFYDPRAAAQQQQQQQQQQQTNLPPAEVSKTIPCRNFPNCKYGSACVFFHPRGQSGFYGANGGPAPSFPGYEQGYNQNAQGYQQMPYFAPQSNGFQHQQSQSQQPQDSQPMTNDTQHENRSQHQQQQQHQSASALPSDSSMPIENDSNNVQPSQFHDPSQAPQQMPPPPHELSSAPAPFVPFGMTSPTQPQFGISPMSPPMMPMSPHDAAAFFASSPPNGMMIPPPQSMNGFVPRRQSINQGYPGKPFGHGKKPSFSGGPRPWNGPGRAPAWKDGNPPPCAFFAQGKCRNGDFCKFPHLDAEGADCRHPDVIRGLIAPAPPLARAPRSMRMGGFNQFDPTRQFVPRAQTNGDDANGHLPTPVEAVVAESTPAAVTETVEQSQEKIEEVEVGEADKTVPTPSAPSAATTQQQQQQPNLQVNGNGNGNGIARSASQPGVQRFQANGFHSRSQSPAPSNVSFQGNGHPRRGGRPFNAGLHNGGGNASGPRSVSAGERKQRIPSADEFPALGGASGNTSPAERSTATFSKTAAQVLSAPAPPKPETPKQEAVAASEDGVTMDSDSDSDAVIVTVTKPSTPAPAQESKAASTSTQTQEKKAAPTSQSNGTSTSTPAPTEQKRGPISFASVASSVASAAGLTSAPAPAPASTSGPIESAPVALKA